MADQKPILWHRRVRLKPDTPRDRWFSHKTWKQLRWRMTEADVATWADNNGGEIEKVEGSGETREELRPTRLWRIGEPSAGDGTVARNSYGRHALKPSF